MDNFYQTQRPYNPYQNQAYTIPYIGNITSVKGAEGCNAFKMGANRVDLMLPLLFHQTGMHMNEKMQM